MLRIDDISYAVEGRPLFEGASATIPEGHKVGLVGPSLGDYPGLSGMLGAEGVDFTITSLRASRASTVRARQHSSA